MKNFSYFLLIILGISSLGAYLHTPKISYEYASIVVEYYPGEQFLYITDQYYETHSFKLQSRSSRKITNPPNSSPGSLTVNIDSSGERKRRIQSPGTETISQIPSLNPPPNPEESLSLSKNIPLTYEIRGKYDNSQVFRLMAAYQEIGWEIMDTEFGIGAEGSFDDAGYERSLFVLMRREVIKD